MTNQDIAKLLRQIAAAYTIKDEKKYRFQITAYQSAAETIEGQTTEIKDIFTQEKTKIIPGVGPTITAYLKELLEKGRLKHFEEILKSAPEAIFPLLDIPTFGPKKSYKIVKAFNLKNSATVISDVKNLAKKGEIAKLEGFGQKSEQDILRAIEEYKSGLKRENRMVLPYAFELAAKILNYLRSSKFVQEAYPLGSLRRMASTVGDIDIAVSSQNPKAVIEHFIQYPKKERIIEKGEKTASIFATGERQIDLMVQAPKSFGSLLQHFTGSKTHNIALREHALSKNMSLSEYGIKQKQGNKIILKRFRTEQDLYKFLGLAYIPPELREGGKEIELAKINKLPKLVGLSDIKGDLHIHSNYDIETSHDVGLNSFEEIINKASSLSYKYIAFSEHNPSVGKHSKNEIYSILKRRKEKIEQLKKSNKNIRIINLLEIDILANGNLAVDDKSLNLIDAAIVSIHSSFQMDKAIMTRRILKGLSHSKAKIFAHPTGRLLEERKGFDADWNCIFEFARKHNKACEINSSPNRLDLPDALVYKAKEHGIKFVISTDAHAINQMDNMFYGVSTARRGWCTTSDILNTLPYQELSRWLLN